MANKTGTRAKGSKAKTGTFGEIVGTVLSLVVLAIVLIAIFAPGLFEFVAMCIVFTVINKLLGSIEIKRRM